MIRIVYILKRLARGIRRRPLGSLFTLVAWWFALCQLILVFHTVTVAGHVKEVRGTTSTMIAYLAGAPSQGAVEEIRWRIAAMEEIGDVVFIPRQAGLERLKQWMGPDNPLIAGLDPGVLPDAFEVTVKPLFSGRIEDIAKRVQAIRGVEDVRYDRGIFGYIADAYQSILLAGGAVALVVIVSLSLVIFLSIRVSIVSRSQEIEVLHNLGAQRSFLYAPYLFEALMYGVGGALLAILATEAAAAYILSRVPILNGILTPLGPVEIASVVAFSSLWSLLGAYPAIKKTIDG
ncbi:MAG TPA: permease-like cell division protein FtsX [Deltaproteobacteria bacterium]|jgi:cell division transport system permease protein|nr:permease-like cell division protein FtsX [Deltaproteobacteria bacterium]HOI07937.1 permease-like cell division protein FtsX [Deltaproteobacteria bacterium]